jgi:hypothetical protein
MFSSEDSEDINEVRLRRASLPRCARSTILVSAESGDSIHSGIFSRFPVGSMTETAPSPRFGLRTIERLQL